MYLEFDLPNGTILTDLSEQELLKQLYAWAAAKRTYILNEHRVKARRKYRLELSDERAYQEFALTWNPDAAWMRAYTIEQGDLPEQPKRVLH